MNSFQNNLLPFPGSKFPSLQAFPLLDRAVHEATCNTQTPREMAFHAALSVIVVAVQNLFDVEYLGQKKLLSLFLLLLAISGERKSSLLK